MHWRGACALRFLGFWVYSSSRSRSACSLAASRGSRCGAGGGATGFVAWGKEFR